VSHNDSSREEFDGIREKLRAALPTTEPQALRRDLWPDMLRRLERSQIRVPWFDWALLGFVGAVAIFLPELIPALLYHL
jgi:hypothetical protein